MRENITTDAKHGKILQLVGRAGKDYNLWKAWENITTGGKRGKILQPLSSAGKFHDWWEVQETLPTGGEAREMTQLGNKHKCFSHCNPVCWCFFGVILAQFVVLYWVFSLSQVREMAAVTFSGLVHYGFFQLDDELQVQDYGCHFLNCFSST